MIVILIELILAFILLAETIEKLELYKINRATSIPERRSMCGRCDRHKRNQISPSRFLCCTERGGLLFYFCGAILSAKINGDVRVLKSLKRYFYIVGVVE